MGKLWMPACWKKPDGASTITRLVANDANVRFLSNSDTPLSGAT
jgi:hypothetical protein